MRRILVLLSLGVVSLAQAADAPVAVPANELHKIKLFERLYQTQTGAPIGSVSKNCGGLLDNGTDYEIVSLTVEMQVFDTQGTSVQFRKQVVLKGVFEDEATGYLGSMLPRSRAHAYQKVMFPNVYSVRPYWIEIKAATGLKAASDLTNVGHFFSEIARGGTANVESFLRRHRIYATMPVGQPFVSAVHVAAAHDRVDLLRFLHGMGANLVVPDGDNDQPIHLAAATGATAAVKYLLSQHADPNAISRPGNGYTPLSYAAKFDRVGTAAELLRAGAKINLMPNPKGATALTQAVYWGGFNVFKLLLKHGANPNVTRPEQFQTLVLSTQKGVQWVTLLLAAGADPNLPRSKADAFTALHQAATEGNPDVVRLLLAHGANPNIRDRRGMTPYDFAISTRRSVVAEILRSAMQHYNSTA